MPDIFDTLTDGDVFDRVAVAPPSAPSASTDQERGVVGGIGAGLARGVGGMLKGFEGYADYVNATHGIPPPPTGTSAADALGLPHPADVGNRIIAANPASPSVEQGGAFQPGNWRWYSEKGTEMVPILLSQLGMLSLSKGESAPMQFMAFAGPAAAQAAGNTFEDTFQRTGDKNLAMGEATMNGLVTLAMQRVNLAPLLKNSATKKYFQDQLMNRVAEMGAKAFQEGGANAAVGVAQAATEDTLKYMAESDPAAFKDWQSRYAGAAVQGAVAGATIGGIHAAGDRGAMDLAGGEQVSNPFGSEADIQTPKVAPSVKVPTAPAEAMQPSEFGGYNEQQAGPVPEGEPDAVQERSAAPEILQRPQAPEVRGGVGKGDAQAPPGPSEEGEAPGSQPESGASPEHQNDPQLDEGVKEPWQMTSDEWNKEFEATRPNAQGTGGGGPRTGIGQSDMGARQAAKRLIARQEFLKMALSDVSAVEGMSLGEAQKEGLVRPARHRDVIEKAIQEGKPIPADVLKDYPELKPKEPPRADHSVDSLLMPITPQDEAHFVTAADIHQEIRSKGEAPEPKPEAFANTKAAIKKALSTKKGTVLGSGLGGLSDYLEHATNISVAIVKDLAAMGKHGFEHFVKTISDQVADARLRKFMIQGERDQVTKKMVGGARALYNAARAHPDITTHGIENAMTPADKLPSALKIGELAKRTPEQIAAHREQMKAIDAAPPKPLTEKGILREATIKPTESTKETVRRTTGMTDTSEPVSQAKALKGSLKRQAVAAAEGFKTGEAAEENRQATAEQDAGETIPMSKAIKVGMEIRAKAEAAMKGVADDAELKQRIRDTIMEAAADYPPSMRGGLLNAMRDATTPLAMRKVLDRMDERHVELKAREAKADLRDVIGGVKRESKGPTLASEITKDLVNKPEDPLAGGRIDPKKQTPAARDALTDVVGNLRSPDGSAKGASKLADFIQAERDAGHSNDAGMTDAEIATLRGLDGKSLSEMKPEETKLLTQAIQHAAFLGEQFNEAVAGSRIREVQAQRDEQLEGMRTYHPEKLPPGTRGELATGPKKNPISNFVGNVLRDPFRFLKLNLGKGGEAMWKRFADGQTKSFEAINEAKDTVAAARKRLGISDKDWLEMSQKGRKISLGFRQITLTPREIISFINGYGRETTRRDMERAGIVPKRLKGQPNETFKVSAIDAQKIMDAATPAEKELARVMQEQLVNSQLHKDANAASVRESGYEKLTEPGYWPRSRDFEQAPGAVVESMQQFRDTMLKDMGFLKDAPGTPHAPVVLEDAGDVFNRHVSQVARFAHLNDATRDMTMITSDPAFSTEAKSRLGKQFSKQLTDTIQRLTGMEEHVDIPGAKLMSAVRARIATGELMFRLTSALNHFMGGALAVNKIPEGSQAAFFKNFALKAIPDMAMIRDMESRNGYLRNRGQTSGRDLESPVDVEAAPKGRFGRALEKAGDVGTAHIRLGDRMDSAAVYKTFIEKYQAEHPGATDDAAKNWAAKQTEYAVRQTATASTPFENSYFAQRVGRVPVLNLLTLFQSKTSAMRNTIDEAFQDWRINKNQANTRKLVTATASVAAMIAAYAAVGAGSTAIKKGFQPQTRDDEKKAGVSEATQLAAHVADIIAPGIGGTAARDLQAALKWNSQNADIVTETGMKAASDFNAAIQAGRTGEVGTAIEKAADTLNGAGKFFGVSAEQPTQYAEGIVKGFGPRNPKVTKERLTDMIRAGQEKQAGKLMDAEYAAGRLGASDIREVQEAGTFKSDDDVKFHRADAKEAITALQGMSSMKRRESPRPGEGSFLELAKAKIEKASISEADKKTLRAKLEAMGGPKR